MTDREFAIDVVRKLQNAGFTALWAGGCVRDEQLGLTPEDYDVATSAKPEELRPLFRRRNEIGAHFGVVQVIGPRADDGEWLTIEVATFRSDGTYSDGRRPDAVIFSSPEEDAKRRDFTINGMFFDPIREQLIDFIGGQADLRAKVLRAIGDPFERFTEDKLRILRAARMATRFALTIDPQTHAAAKQMAPQIRVVSAERIHDELRKLCAHRHRARGLRLLAELELAEPIFPEVADTATWAHAVRVLEACTEPVSFPLALAVVLHSLPVDRIAHIGERLRLSTVELTRVCWLVEHQAFLREAQTMRASKLKPILVHPGIGELLTLHRAIAIATAQSCAPVEYCERILRETPREELNPVPLVTGADLIALGLKPGPLFKRLLEITRNEQLDDAVKTKPQALELVQRLLQEPGFATEQ